jgi:hypothetical protein
VGNRCGDAQLVHPGRSGGFAGSPGGSEPPPPLNDPRVVQQYRQKVLHQIVAACADGRLEPGELAARSEAAQQATTLSGLSAIVADVPGHGQAAMAGHQRRARRFILGFLVSAGWRPFRALAARVRAAAVLGEVMIDLRRTAVTSFVTEITAVALAGEVRIVIPAGFRVDAGFAATVLGRTVAVIPPERPGALTPVIRLRSVAVLGNVLTSQVPPVS